MVLCGELEGWDKVAGRQLQTPPGLRAQGTWSTAWGVRTKNQAGHQTPGLPRLRTTIQEPLVSQVLVRAEQAAGNPHQHHRHHHHSLARLWKGVSPKSLLFNGGSEGRTGSDGFCLPSEVEKEPKHPARVLPSCALDSTSICGLSHPLFELIFSLQNRNTHPQLRVVARQEMQSS